MFQKLVFQIFHRNAKLGTWDLEFLISELKVLNWNLELGTYK